VIRRRAALLLLVAIAAHADAEVLALPSTKATIDLPIAWKPTSAPNVVLGATGPADEILALTRSAVPNPDAWRPKKRDAYVEQIEKGVAAKIKGYRRVTKKVGETNTIPTFDLEAKRDDGATILVRVLLFRTYALSLAIEVPRRVSPNAARAIVQSFTAPLPSGT
jgi:hypothetical protein